ncbi:MAG: hypothetical protein MUF51_05900 [Vicinamibacteria bacterium]|jgi:hypothetical protein|nr:hypothetical protein [Vicinamibacteria bacterium]
MTRPRAESFADRLPPVVPKEEADISHLSDEMAEVLYPGRRKKPFRISVVFDAFPGESYERALEIARAASAYREEPTADGPRHHATFVTEQANKLRNLFVIVGSLPGTEILVNEQRAPYAREIWLPLMWLFVGEED